MEMIFLHLTTEQNMRYDVENGNGNVPLEHC